MKFVAFILTLITCDIQAQTLLTFNKRFIESEDKWVAFKQDKDSSYAYGFIYIDPQAGLTLQHEGNFIITGTRSFVPKRDTFNIKVRLEPNNVLVAWIPATKFPELKIEATPDWLKYYKSDTTSFEHLFQWGYMYNGWELCEKALTYLERAQKMKPESKELNTELAFSYNCLAQYAKSIPLLTRVLESDPGNAYSNKELIYAQIKLGQLDKAAISCDRALRVCKDTTYNAENCYNLLSNFYLKKDKANFQLWLTTTKKWTAGNNELTRNINKMEAAILKVE